MDMAALQNGILHFRNINLKNVFPIAATISNRKKGELRTLHAVGTVLKPKRQYYNFYIVLVYLQNKVNFN